MSLFGKKKKNKKTAEVSPDDPPPIPAGLQPPDEDALESQPRQGPTDPGKAFQQLTRKQESRPTHEPARRQREEVLESVAQLSNLPALSSIAQSLQDTLRKVDTDVALVVETIKKDAALAAKVLQIANSPYYRGSHEVETLDEAVMHIGIEPIRRLAAMTRTLRDAQKIAQRFDWRCLWMHNIATGIIAEDLCTIFGIEVPNVLNTACLLHDIGKVVLSDLYPADYHYVIIRAYEGMGSLEEEELRVFQITHADAGAHFAKAHKFPQSLIAAVECHSKPSEAGEHQTLTALVQVADYFAKKYNLGYSGDRAFESQEHENLEGWAILNESASPQNKEYLKVYKTYLSVSLKNSTEKAAFMLAKWFPEQKEAIAG